MKHYEDIYRSEGRAEGRTKCLAEGKRISYFEIIHDGYITVEKGALKTNTTVEEFIKKMNLFGFDLPEK